MENVASTGLDESRGGVSRCADLLHDAVLEDGHLLGRLAVPKDAFIELVLNLVEVVALVGVAIKRVETKRFVVLNFCSFCFNESL